MKALLEIAAPGGYLHQYENDPSCYPAHVLGDPQMYDLRVKGVRICCIFIFADDSDSFQNCGRLSLSLAKRVGPNRAPGDKAAVMLFHHPALCRISSWIINFFICEVPEAVEKFVDGTNPFIQHPETEGNYVPPYVWLTAVSCGFVSS